jgi:hypothetical protein
MRIGSVLLGCAALALTVPARAQQETVAETLFREARAEMKTGAYASACPKLAESQRLDPSPGTLLNLAICERRLGRVATAWVRFREVLDTVPARDPRAQIARDELAQLEPQLPMLRIVVAPDVAATVRIRLDGVELGSASLNVDLPVDPGQHRLEVADAAGRTAETSIAVALGERIERELPPLPAAPLATPTPAEPPQPRPLPQRQAQPESLAPSHDEARATPVSTLGLVAAGVGAAAITAGAIFALRAKSLKDDSNSDGHCDDTGCDDTGYDLRNQAITSGNIATVLFVSGGVLAAAGIGLYVAVDGFASTPRAASVWINGRF